MPRFSIIMPTYRREHIIGNTIEYIHKQTFTDWELILVDNHDSSYHEAVKPYPRIRHFVYTEKRGASHARNFGIDQIKGEFTCFFDDDDIMHPDYLESFNEAFKNPNVMMAHCGMRVMRGNSTDFSFATPEVVIRSQFVTRTWVPCDSHDQIYFDRIAVANEWVHGKQILLINSVLVTARSDSKGGLRGPGAGY